MTAPAVVVVEPDATERRRLAEALGPGVVAVASPAEMPADPAVVVAGPSLDDARWPATGALVAVTHRYGTAALRSALAAGATDLVDAAAPVTQLRHAVRRAGLAAAVANHRRAGRPVPDAVVTAPLPAPLGVFAPKGGAGATTVAVNVAATVADRGVPVVVVDANVQFGDVALMFGVDPGASLAAVDPARPGQAAGLVVVDPVTSVGVLAGPVDPAVADAVTGDAVVAALDAVVAGPATVVVDLPGRLDDVVVALCDRLGHLLVVTAMDLAAVKDTRLAIDTLARMGVSPSAWSLVCNAVGAPGTLPVAAVESQLGVAASCVVPHDATVPESLTAGHPVVVTAPGSPAARALAALGDRVATADAWSLPGAGGAGGPGLPDGVDGAGGAADWRAGLARLVDGVRASWASGG